MSSTRRSSILERVRARLASRRRGTGPAVRDRRGGLRARIEDLEPRALLATINVGSTADVANYPAGVKISGLTVPAAVTLIDAIHAANNTGGRNTIVLQRLTYALGKVDNAWYGPNGLPAISSDVTINGNGATIERTGTTTFRFFYVSSGRYGGLPTGNLTLNALTLKGGVAQGGATEYGGGGLGAGGAIFNQGTLTLNSVLLTSNTAYGGSADTSSETIGGGGIGQPAQRSSPGGFGGLLPGGRDFSTGGPTREGQGGGYGFAPGFGGGGAADGGMGGFGGGGGSRRGQGGFGGGPGEGRGTYSYYGGGGAALGGAIFNRGGRVTITDSTIAGNAANGGYASFYSSAGDALGGGIFNLDGTIRLVNDTIANNGLGASGAGNYSRADGFQIYNLADTLANSLAPGTATASIRMVNTIAAGTPSGGHDIVNQTVLNDPAKRNQALVSNDSGVQGATNVVPRAIPNLDGTFAPGGRGVVDVGVIAKDPQLGGLQDNGGWSATMAISAGSPAAGIGATGAVKGIAYDQRGAIFTRTTSGRVDAGAYQIQDYTQDSPLARLSYFDPVTKLFLPVQSAHSIRNSSTAPVNVYVISHGWMPGLDGWVGDSTSQGNLPLSWQTWQGPNYYIPTVAPIPVPSTPWLFQGSGTGNYYNFTVNETGLAQSILKADPHARVLAFSWIDESATPTGAFGIPYDAFTSEGNTTMAGMQEAQAITDALAPNYAFGKGKVHLIGHSHGSRVATVAAVALQKAAESSPKSNVVGQLTLLDSPEDNRYAFPDSSKNPIHYQDSANYDWFYLAQLNPAKPPAGSRADPIFVDSYISYFGSDYSNITVNDKAQGIDKSLGFVHDVNLNPYPIYQNTVFNISQKHQYPANWYAGSVATKGTANQTGLYWSPLIAGSTPPPGHLLRQAWKSVDAQHQFVLTPSTNPPPAVAPRFSTAPIAESSTQGTVVVTKAGSNVTAVRLDEHGAATSAFGGVLTKSSGDVVGVSFDYRFTSAIDPGAKLQILLNNNQDVYFSMSAGLADARILPGSNAFSSTFGLGSAPDGPKSIQIRLVPGKAPDRLESVVVSNFQVFTM